MRVFISWSGTYSERVAVVLRDWLPMVLQNVEPWVSSEDIAKGGRWSSELERALREAMFGIICVNADNANEPWINFEAGAMSNAFDSSKVSPLLSGIEPEELPGSLAQFQCTRIYRDDVRRLVKSINEASPSPIPAERVNKVFDLAWFRLTDQLGGLGAPPSTANAEAVTPASAKTQMPESQTKILVFLGQNPKARPTADEIARAIGENVTHTRYHLDQLMKRDLVFDLLNMMAPTRYGLSEGGRAHVVENDLV